MGECFFRYRPTRVVPDQRPLNGRCCCCCITVRKWIGIVLRSTYIEYCYSPDTVNAQNTIHTVLYCNTWSNIPSLFFAALAPAEARDHLCNFEPVCSAAELCTRFCNHRPISIIQKVSYSTTLAYACWYSSLLKNLK